MISFRAIEQKVDCSESTFIQNGEFRYHIAFVNFRNVHNNCMRQSKRAAVLHVARSKQLPFSFQKDLLANDAVYFIEKGFYTRVIVLREERVVQFKVVPDTNLVILK